jgi:hypothetical protein
MMFIQSRPQVVLAVLQVLAEKARYTTASVEKSIQMASSIAQGNYDQLISEETAPATSVSNLNDLHNTETETELADRLPSLVGGAFAHVAAALRQREKTIAAQASEL